MFALPKLSYSYDALEPYIDAATMEIHYTKHHQAYLDKLNAALENHPQWQERTIEEILKNIDQVPEKIREAVRNHGGGHSNHTLFWESLSPQAEAQPSDSLAEALTAGFDNVDSFKQAFTDAALARFGSGWAWLVLDGGQLRITSTPNQDSPYMHQQTPLLGLDVWEHAYYLKYQNRRLDYVDAFWNVVNWDVVERRYAMAKG